MAIHTFWDDQARTRIVIEFETAWTWDDLTRAVKDVDTHISSVGHAVDIIIDVEGSELPRDFIAAAKKMLSNNPAAPRDNEGNRVVVGANDTIRNVYQTLQRTFGERLVGREVLFAEDLLQARSMLYSMRLGD
jgi:hypothetical protein